MQAVQTLHYKNSHFATQLPVAYLYSPSHYWVADQGGGIWRVGLTRFATRMLGDMVDFAVEKPAAAAVEIGEIIGWVEGFKAIADIFAVAAGSLHQVNPGLKEKMTRISKEPYGAGWIYEVAGRPDPNCVDVHAYKVILDKTIAKILEKQKDAAIE
jgi:glycine cleavage system H protein